MKTNLGFTNCNKILICTLQLYISNINKDISYVSYGTKRKNLEKCVYRVFLPIWRFNVESDYNIKYFFEFCL